MRWLNLIFPISFAVFGLAWMTVVVPGLMDSSSWTEMTPVGQFIVYNIGLFFILTVFFGGMVSWLLHKRLSILAMLVNGLAGFMFFSFVLDMFEPPFVLNHAGEFIIQNGDTLSGAAVDYMTAWVWQGIGIHGTMLYNFTYIVTPILAVIVTVLLLGANRFLKFFQEVVL